MQTLLVARISGRAYGLPLDAVERILPMAWLTSLPERTGSLAGFLNLHGSVLPVVDPRARLGLAAPSLDADQRLVLMAAAQRFLIWVDGIEEIVQVDPDTISSVPGVDQRALVQRVLRLGDQILPVLSPSALDPAAASAPVVLERAA
jgi:purine-binding chemotaxis protein CheW